MPIVELYTKNHTWYDFLMSLWAIRRKAMYTAVFLGVLVVIVGVPTVIFLYDKPTCFDGKKNQKESGVDCGGSCLRLCVQDFAPLVLIWERFSEVVPGVYNLVAYIENPNLTVGVGDMPYAFKVYDYSGTLITERKGITSVPVGKKFAIFEPAIETGPLTPSRVSFDFTADPYWKYSEYEIGLEVFDIKHSEDSGFAKIDARLKNTTGDEIYDIEVIALVYDTNGNAMMFSATKVDELRPKGSTSITFTWPSLFLNTISRVEILPKRIQLQ